jgi:hypothetical protein
MASNLPQLMYCYLLFSPYQFQPQTIIYTHPMTMHDVFIREKIWENYLFFAEFVDRLHEKTTTQAITDYPENLSLLLLQKHILTQQTLQSSA